MSEQREVFGGVPAWLLAEYLVELGGRRADGTVSGAGWSASVVQSPRLPGSLSIGRVTVTIEGPEAPSVMDALRRKAQRGGG